MSWDELQGDRVQHRFSAPESGRFGMSVGRVVVGWGSSPFSAQEELRRTVAAATERLLIIRYPSHMTRLAAVPGSTGREVIPADVLMYWELTDLPLRGVPSGTGGDRLATVLVGAKFDFELLAPLIRASFDGYTNHYSANPSLNADAASQGYVEWAQASLLDESCDVLVLMHASQAVGFATLVHSVEGKAEEVLLAGLAPLSQGRGWYRQLMVAVSEVASARGLSRVIISTQAHNLRVQRAWAGMGFRPFAAITTVHAMQRSDSAKSERVE